MISIGQHIEEVFSKKGIKQSFFAEKINTSERNSYNIFKKDSIDTEKLMVICKVLEFDFFKLFSDELKNKGIISEPEAEYLTSSKSGKKRIFIEVEVDEEEYQSLISKQV